MSSNSVNSKQMAEKIHMFYNLLYHIDDYIKNKKERKGQLRVSKNIRLVLREIISSHINLNYFINKEELETYKKCELYNIKTPESIQKERDYIKQINPVSFNQKTLSTLNFFFNSTNEIFVVNYFSLEKIFNIIKFCFNKTIAQKQREYQNMLENDKNNKNFVLINDNKEEYNNNKNKSTILIKLVRNNINIIRPINNNNLNNTNQLIVKKITKNLSLPLINVRNVNNNNMNNCLKSVGKNLSLLVKSGLLLPSTNKSVYIRQNQKVYSISSGDTNEEKERKKSGNISKTASVKCLVDYNKKESEGNISTSVNSSFVSRFQRMPSSGEYNKGFPLKLSKNNSYIFGRKDKVK